MTKKLYWDDAYTTDFTARILEVIPLASGYKIALDETYFYPEGGGQPADLGSIDGIRVEDVQIEGDTVYHYTKESPTGKAIVACRVDFDRRQDLMQQHSAQHILSRAFEELYDANTVGFHLSPQTLTIDLDRPLGEEALLKAEEKANRIILENRPIIIHYPDAAALAAMPLRKAPKVIEHIRIIEVKDYDFSPCGGTHLKSTGEIGLIKITKSEGYKNGTRLFFNAGWRSFRDYHEKNQELLKVSQDLSVKPLEVHKAVAGKELELRACIREIETLKEELLGHTLDSLVAEAVTLGHTTVILREFKDMEPRLLKKLSVLLTREPGRIALLSNLGEDVKLLFACSENIDISMKDLITEPLDLIQGRGGGQARSAQGGGPLRANSRKALDKAYQDLLAMLH